MYFTFPNLFKIRPDGVVSKNDIGACKIRSKTGVCNLYEAFIPANISEI